jgi:DNA-binding NtrC family response regulator
LTGESGSQFVLLALEIHRGSAAQDGPFLSLAGQAGRADSVDHELFGTEEPRVEMGQLEGAHGGTLFVEEIAQLPIPIQDKLLRYLETGTFFRRGGTRKVISGTRLIAASCRDLAASVESREFRADLYRLLKQYRIAVPPLRERRLDIIPLAEQILSKAAERLGRPAPQLTADAARTLENYSWPGNMQELACVMERVALLSEDPVGVSNLIPDPTLLRTDVSWRDIERQAIEDALRANGGNRTKAAKQLGMSLRKLQYRLNEYGIRRR